MTHTEPFSKFWSEIIGAAAPAYLAPLFFSFTPGLVTQDARLMAASYSVIAPASLIAAIVVVLVRQTAIGNRLLASRRTMMGRILVMAGPLVLIASVIVLGLITLGGAPPSLFLDAVPSAAIGAGITAAKTNR